jgi:hypothetical protein
MGFFFLDIMIDFDLTSDFIRELAFIPLLPKGGTAGKLLQTLISVLLSTLLLLVLLGVNGSITNGLL